ncbi:unnamed protein product [Rotaria socialis]|uniref:Uncharacterized protein n=1 Tax=Rotaria socialis TaxID=392032 RepID=A0A821N8C3_9BILA|nr:unnamed protein product [Rotaria socialis]CAF4545665.1 unnamed protein product [Rotaria socialis]CAF4645121.1 unnamed protein product [Rotaria socialis]CAF4782439.1 unnamed protein product [Rotaria socialis]CAF4855310.1 unnamed protein product [Rotaria socialis]
MALFEDRRSEGSYQIRMAKSYIIEHIRQSQTNEEEMEFLVELCNDHDDLVRARFQSRHSNNKKHIATVHSTTTNNSRPMHRIALVLQVYDKPGCALT